MIMKPMSSWQFTLFRIIFGCYLAIHFAMLIPYASELFGADGLIGDPALNLTAGLFPNPLNAQLPSIALSWIIGGLAALSIAFAAGWLRPLVSICLWFGWTALFHRNNLIGNPSIPYVGLLLLLCALVPTGEPLALARRNETWAMPKWVFRCAWILLAAGYSFSGLTKMSSPSWVDGSAMAFLLENPLARPGFVRDTMLALPSGFLKGLTWFTLLVELAFLPLVLWRRIRPWIWLSMVALHLGIILVVDFADLSFGMLMIHLFTFDPAWLPAKTKSRLILAYDGECLMCSRFIRFLASEDRERVIGFVTLQSAAGEDMRRCAGESDLGSMVVEHNGEVFSKSSAFLILLSALGGHWRILATLGFIAPKRFRDHAYLFVAKRRYRWFGKNASCDLPSAEITERIS
jgi:predicted DCC family thiol-disulfide oxidoreductase YuxK